MDALTITILGIILPGLVAYLRGALADHLEGGKHQHLTADEVAGVLTHNKFCERMFGYWKFLLTYKPNISDLTAEAFTLFALNKTADWIDAKSESERNEIISKSAKDVKTLRQQYKQRHEEIKLARRQNLGKGKGPLEEEIL